MIFVYSFLNSYRQQLKYKHLSFTFWEKSWDTNLQNVSTVWITNNCTSTIYIISLYITQSIKRLKHQIGFLSYSFVLL